MDYKEQKQKQIADVQTRIKQLENRIVFITHEFKKFMGSEHNLIQAQCELLINLINECYQLRKQGYLIDHDYLAPLDIRIDNLDPDNFL